MARLLCSTTNSQASAAVLKLAAVELLEDVAASAPAREIHERNTLLVARGLIRGVLEERPPMAHPNPNSTAGPLAGLRILEFAALGPAPHAAMVLADLGADVVRIERASATGPKLRGANVNVMTRGRRTLTMDLKDVADIGTALALARHADVVIEGMRPGVAERLGIGPADCQRDNPGLVYARMTGWGQTGPLAARAGHDINYISVNGTLDAIGRAGERPLAPVNLVGDFGGGSMLLVVGVLAALWERRQSGRGQVVDAAMVDGSSLLTQMVWELAGAGAWRPERGTNLIDSGAPFYDTYRCSDGGHVAVGALEPEFYARLLSGLGIDPADLPDQSDEQGWPLLRERFTEVFASRDRHHWESVFADTDACVTPVLTMAEAVTYPHLVARQHTVPTARGPQPAPAPRFSRTPSPDVREAVRVASASAILTEWSQAQAGGPTPG